MYVYYIIAGVIIVLLNMLVVPAVQERSVQKTDYSTFIENVEDGNVTKATVEENYIYYEMKDSNSGNMVLCKTVKMDDSDLVNRLLDAGVTMDEVLPESPSILMTLLLSYVVPIVIFIFIGRWLSKKIMSSMGGGPGGAMSFGKSNAKVYVKSSTGIKFSDVAGEDEAKDLLTEIVDYLHNPQKYTEIGASMPKGALLVGPPGTGKTLLAKAVAGEAEVPFFSISGSEFVEMFVGMGAAKVRDLFKQANEKAPCIVFIDEIDTIGKKRDGAGFTGGNDEREQTLNQLLTEMDGFDGSKGVVILGATNRPEILDKALLRAGRFDRQIHVELPDLNERKEIFGVHLRPIKIDESVDAEFLARQTPGVSGADIANVCNEAALIAARNGKKFVQKEDFMNAVDRIVGGLEKRSKITTEEERKCIANHEAGHATLSWLLEHANPLVKVTIVPRGKALGAAWYLPEERQITTREQLQDEMCATLGGRAAEELVLGKISTGASNDLERVTKQAYAMVVYFGMSDKLPNLNYYDSTGQDWGFTKPYSEETAKLIDTEVQKIINEQYDRAKRILSENKEGHSKLAQVLLDREVIYSEDVEHIFGKRAWISRSQEILELQEKANGKNKENADKEAKADATMENVTDTPTEENKTGKIA